MAVNVTARLRRHPPRTIAETIIISTYSAEASSSIKVLTFIRIAIIPPIIIIHWNTSVQITALMPPCKDTERYNVTHDYYKLYSFRSLFGSVCRTQYNMISMQSFDFHYLLY